MQYDNLTLIEKLYAVKQLAADGSQRPSVRLAEIVTLAQEAIRDLELEAAIAEERRKAAWYK